jgi:hypothetical protein
LIFLDASVLLAVEDLDDPTRARRLRSHECRGGALGRS